ncbi:MAG: type II toxin-antitoxin system RelE/ParE family toxin [Planctomycetes bacterium]|nr:type II toxin-antitoxin system RelE/ParE family toxin [Planctomycetota bacterium]
MAAELILHPDVGADIAEAYSWYEARRAGLGEEFLGCVDACIESICRNPQIHAIVEESYRRALVRRFPYAVFYEHTETATTVYAVFHTSRDPDKWRSRLPS